MIRVTAGKRANPVSFALEMDAPVDFTELRGAAGFDSTLQWEGSGGGFLLGVREYGASVYTSGGDAYHFDLEGRLRRARIEWENGVAADYLRGLDGRLLRKVRRVVRAGTDPGNDRLDRPAERREVFSRTHRAAVEALESIPPGRGRGRDSPRDILERCAAFDPPRLEDEARRFLEAYRPLGILPPDRYAALILQATEGCAYNACAFCDLYARRPFRAKTPGDLRDHARRVKAFLGRALPLRKGLFLGEANALAIEQHALVEILGIALEEFPRQAAAGLHAFLDVFTLPRKSARELRQLADLGLRRVYLGVESGDEEVLRLLRKPTSNADVREVVTELKLAGVSVGLILLVGAGGARLRESHREESVSLIKDLPLDAGDFVYLSPLHVPPGSVYEGRARREGVRDLLPHEVAEEEATFRRCLAPRPGERGPRVARYDVSSFVYY